MKKIFLVCIIGFIASFSVFGEAAGMEVSVFVPESLYLYDDGSVAVTSGLGTGLGLSDYFEIPIGFDFCKLHGLMVEGASVDGEAVTASKPWFIADNFVLYAKLQANLTLGPIILSAFGGGAGAWNATLTPLEGYAADDVAEDGGYAGFTEFSASAPFGYGWLAGASFGVKIDAVTVNVFGEYRALTFPLTMTADYLTGTSEGLTTAKSLNTSAASLKMRGYAVGIGGSFAF